MPNAALADGTVRRPESRDGEVALTAFELVYAYLGRAFYESPSAEFIGALVAQDAFADWPLAADDEHSQAGLALLCACCARWTPTDVIDLVSDYNRLFVGPEQLLAPPWESVHLGVEHLLFDLQTLDVRAFYARFGMRAPRMRHEPDDHLGLELFFMAHLCDLGLAAAQTGDDDGLRSVLQSQRQFLEQHILRWVPLFLDQVLAVARTDYYRGVAHLALGCLAAAVAST